MSRWDGMDESTTVVARGRPESEFTVKHLQAFMEGLPVVPQVVMIEFMDAVYEFEPTIDFNKYPVPCILCSEDMRRKIERMALEARPYTEHLFVRTMGLPVFVLSQEERCELWAKAFKRRFDELYPNGIPFNGVTDIIMPMEEPE